MFSGIVYSPEATVRMPLLSLLHSFDLKAHHKAFNALVVRFGAALEGKRFLARDGCSESNLLLVHDDLYLKSLASGRILAEAFDLFWIRLVPKSVRHRCILRPLLVAVQSSVIAVELALAHGLIYHIGGGFHHAGRSRAAGYCIFADAVIAIRAARAKGLLRSDERLLYIDLDAHFGNGVYDLLRHDSAVYGIDIHNKEKRAKAITDEAITSNWRILPIDSDCDDDTYLQILNQELVAYFRTRPLPRLAIYNAGTDVVAGDPLGELALTAAAVERRDKLVIDMLASAGICTVVLASGGYSPSTPSLISQAAAYLLDLCAVPSA